jgi:hypothetical protein
MLKKIIGTIFFISAIAGNLSAINMSYNYKVPINMLDNFFDPIEHHKNIIEIKPNHIYNAGFMLDYTIFVKKNLHNMGIYKWSRSKNHYVGLISRRVLVFKKNNLYLISKISKINNNFMQTYLKRLDKKKILEKKLKSLFYTYSKTYITHKEFEFYSRLIQDFIKKKLLYFKNSEYFFLIDKNTQKGYIFAYDGNTRNIKYIGGDKLSTGNSKLNSRNNRFFETPIAIINRKHYHKGDWRANKGNFSEYGTKGSRVFYLGKYMIPIQYNSKIRREVHLAIHSTNPIDSKLLGHKASKGCIRISQNLNKILSKSGIIDGQNGKYVIIIDSSLSIKENLRRLYNLKSKKYSIK